MLNDDELRDAVLLVFANKQDLPQAISPPEMKEWLDLNNLRSREWSIQYVVEHVVMVYMKDWIGYHHHYHGENEDKSIVCNE